MLKCRAIKYDNSNYPISSYISAIYIFFYLALFLDNFFILSSLFHDFIYVYNLF